MRLLIISCLLISAPFFLSAQDGADKSKRQRNRLNFGASMNIPINPTNDKYGLGYGLMQQYEYLLWSHLSIMESFGFNMINGKKVNEFYENQNVTVDYDYFRSVPLQIGAGFYFGEGQSTFFILFKGGISWFWSVSPAYPEIVVNGNVVKEAIPRKETNGSFGFFTPKIGWQFKHLQLTLAYQGSVKKDAQINVFNIGVAYNVIKP